MSDVIDINDRKKKVRILPSSPTFKVRINYWNVKYIEGVAVGKTKVHFNDGTSLIITRDLDSTSNDMTKALTPAPR